MYKKIALVAATFTLVVSPLLASAQTTTASSNTSLLATLEALVAQLEQELQQLIAAKSSSNSSQSAGNCNLGNPCTNEPSGLTSSSTSCATFASLKRGDTDATTGGEVSKLQAFLGISPTSGYYGAQTAIGYQNKCSNLGNSQPVSVAGMSQYSDPSFGFSFWYPSGWTVSQVQVPANSGALTVATKRLLVASSNNQEAFYVDEFTAPSGLFAASAGCTIDLYFSGQWEQSLSGCDGTTAASPQAAYISANTMGGLHEFLAGGPGTTETVVPLSASNFVTVETFGTDTFGTQKYLADTITATASYVATPVSTAQQTATIQAEANAYGAVQSTSSSSYTASLQTYTNSKYGFSLLYPNTATVNPDCAEGESVCRGNPLIVLSEQNTSNQPGDGFAYGYIAVNAATDPAAVNVSCTAIPPNMHSSTALINGVTFTVLGMGSAGAGTQESFTSYDVVHNGVCYSIAEDEFSHSAIAQTTAEGQAQKDLESVVQSFYFTQ